MPGDYTGAQALYNGIASAGNSIADGIAGYQQNKLIATTQTAKFEAALAKNPDMLKFLTSDQAKTISPDVQAAVQRLQKGGAVGFKDAALLSAFADSYGSQNQSNLNQAQQQAQTSYVGANTANTVANTALLNNRVNFMQSMIGMGAAQQPTQLPPPSQIGSGPPVQPNQTSQQAQAMAQPQGQAPQPNGAQMVGQPGQPFQPAQPPAPPTQGLAAPQLPPPGAIPQPGQAQSAAQPPSPQVLSQMAQGGPMGGQPQAPAQPPANLRQFLPPGGTGAAMPLPKPQVQIQPPTPITISDPQIAANYSKALQMSFGDPQLAQAGLQKQADAINQQRQAQYEAQANAQKPSGNLHFTGTEYKDGLPQFDTYVPEMVKGAGTASQATMPGSTVIKYPHGQTPPQPVVKMGSGEPDTGMTTEGYNTNDPQWQSEVKAANEQALGSSNVLAQANLLRSAAEAYSSGNSSNLNAILANPQAARIKQIVRGTNPQAAFKIALADNTQAVLAQIKGGGSIGGRIMQSEYENTAKMLGGPENDNQAILAAANNLYATADRQNSIDQAYATYRARMPAGDAEALARAQFAPPPKLTNPVNGQPVAQPGGGMVRVTDPSGRAGSIPAGKLSAGIGCGLQTNPTMTASTQDLGFVPDTDLGFVPDAAHPAMPSALESFRRQNGPLWQGRRCGRHQHRH